MSDDNMTHSTTGAMSDIEWYRKKLALRTEKMLDLEAEVARLKHEMKELAQMIEDGFPNAAMKELRRIAGE